jgi:4-hydroxybenzoate polyprenyltransferase
MLRSQIVGLLKASHFGPTVLVVSMTFVLSHTQFSISDSLFIALAIFFGQLVVGWTNDLVDFPRDEAALRLKKPLVAGTISKTTLRVAIFLALGIALVTSLASPLGVKGSAIHFIGLLSATAYNFKLKATVLSVLPYIVSFGALPWAIYVAAGSRPPLWLVLAFMLFTCAFHFLNVLKDLDADINQNVMGLPQVLGRKRSICVAAILASVGLLDVALAII